MVSFWQIFFGEGIEAGIDLQGNLCAWPKEKLPASTDTPEKWKRRENITQIDNSGDNVMVGFTRV